MKCSSRARCFALDLEVELSFIAVVILGPNEKKEKSGFVFFTHSVFCNKVGFQTIIVVPFGLGTYDRR